MSKSMHARAGNLTHLCLSYLPPPVLLSVPPCLFQDGVSHCAPFPSFFQLPVLMLMLITLLTDGALISVGYDIVKPNPIPEQWNLVRLFIIASVMGGVSLGACIMFLECFLHQASTHATDLALKYRLVAAALGCRARLEQSEWHVRGAGASPH